MVSGGRGGTLLDRWLHVPTRTYLPRVPEWRHVRCPERRTIHLPKLAPWVVFQGAASYFCYYLYITSVGYHCTGEPPIPDCLPSTVAQVTIYLMVGMCVVYLALYWYYIRKTFEGRASRPYAAARTANMLVRVEVRCGGGGSRLGDWAGRPAPSARDVRPCNCALLAAAVVADGQRFRGHHHLHRGPAAAAHQGVLDLHLGVALDDAHARCAAEAWRCGAGRLFFV